MTTEPSPRSADERWRQQRRAADWMAKRVLAVMPALGDVTMAHRQSIMVHLMAMSELGAGVEVAWLAAGFADGASRPTDDEQILVRIERIVDEAVAAGRGPAAMEAISELGLRHGLWSYAPEPPKPDLTDRATRPSMWHWWDEDAGQWTFVLPRNWPVVR